MAKITPYSFTIIVPFRNRFGHLGKFIPHMRARFPNQDILIVEQEPGKGFNRAKLLNVGFLEAEICQEYFCFHDVDMLPSRADYSYPVNPTQLATKVQQFGYRMPFAEYFGGVTLFNRADFVKCNGYSNNFWTWGAEDNEMYDNVKRAGLTIDYRQGFFESLHHRQEDRSEHGLNVEKWKAGRGEKDGLTHCEYKVLETFQYEGIYKRIIVSI